VHDFVVLFEIKAQITDAVRRLSVLVSLVLAVEKWARWSEGLQNLLGRMRLLDFVKEHVVRRVLCVQLLREAKFHWVMSVWTVNTSLGDSLGVRCWPSAVHNFWTLFFQGAHYSFVDYLGWLVRFFTFFWSFYS
jgi:hypothetical protein